MPKEEIPADVADVFGFDPFEGEDGEDNSSPEPTQEEESSQAENQEGDDVADGDEDEGQETARPAGKKQAGQQTEEEDDVGEPDELAVLRETVKTLQAQLAGKQQQQPQQPKQQQQQQKAQPEKQSQSQQPDVPDYQFTIPDQLVDMLASEDVNERRTAIGALATGLARNIHQSIMQSVETTMAPRFEQLPQTMQQMQQVRETAKTVHQDFYGKFKELNKQEYYPIVTEIAREVMQEMGTQQWSEKVRDEIGKRTRERLGFKPKAPQQTQTKAPPAKKGPAAMFSQGARPPMKRSGRSEADDVVDTLLGD